MNLNQILNPSRNKARDKQENDQRILENLHKYRYLNRDEISNKLKKLSNEWDIDKTLKINATAVAIASFILKAVTRRRGFWLTGALAGFIWHHGIRNWASGLPIMKRMGKRTQDEINAEIYSLKILRGDFDHISGTSEPEQILKAMRI
jgi:hypothetical protein